MDTLYKHCIMLSEGYWCRLEDPEWIRKKKKRQKFCTTIRAIMSLAALARLVLLTGTPMEFWDKILASCVDNHDVNLVQLSLLPESFR